MFLVDSHCHLGDMKFGGKEISVRDALNNAACAGVTHMLCVCTDLPSFPSMYEKIQDFDNVYATVGVHPLNISEPRSEEMFLRYAAREKVIGIGEIGLDYHYESDSAEIQKQVFSKQLEYALKLKKPIVIHSREAAEDTWSVLSSSDPDQKLTGIFHCYADSLENARRVLDRGFYISVSGIVTFGRAVNIKELARFVPMDRLLLETDSPYLAPVPFRGKPNQPAYVEKVAHAVAELKGVSYEEICSRTSENFERLFGIKLK